MELRDQTPGAEAEEGGDCEEDESWGEEGAGEGSKEAEVMSGNGAPQGLLELDPPLRGEGAGSPWGGRQTR